MTFLDAVRAYLKGDPETGELPYECINPVVDLVGEALEQGEGYGYSGLIPLLDDLTNDELFRMAWGCENYHASLVGSERAYAATMVAISCASILRNRLNERGA